MKIIARTISVALFVLWLALGLKQGYLVSISPFDLPANFFSLFSPQFIMDNIVYFFPLILSGFFWYAADIVNKRQDK